MEDYKDKEFLVREYVEKGRSMNEIADDFDVTGASVYYYIDKYDIETRDQLQESKRKRRVEYANFRSNDTGHELWKSSDTEGGEVICYVARLLAVAEYGVEAVKNKDVHHKNHIPWDNRPENIKPLKPSEHNAYHKAQMQDTWANKDTPWRDKERLERMYYEQGNSLSEMADKLDCDDRTVRLWMDKYGLERRSRKEARNL